MSFKQLRINAKINSVSELAKMVGKSKSYIYKIEEGYSTPGKKLIPEMAKAYGCTIEQIFLACNITFSEKAS